ALAKMAVDAIVRDVGLPVLEPLDRDVAGAEIRVLDLARRLEPVQALGLLRPEAIRVLDRAGVHVAVFGGVDMRAASPLGRNLIDLVGHLDPPTRHDGRSFGRPMVICQPILCAAALMWNKDGVTLWSGLV